MDYKLLGKTGVEVSQLCLGTMTFGGPCDEKESSIIFKNCRNAGINFFDCANVYEEGRSEKILGKLISGIRNEVIVTSKVYSPTGSDINSRGNTRKHIKHALEDSLRRLNTDYIDIYFLHRFDDLTPIGETLRVLDDLVKEGKILYIGASNFAAWQVAKGNGICSLNNWNKIQCIQPMYNLVKRQAEVELFPMSKTENIGVITYSPLGGGLLTGKYSKNNELKKGRLIENKMYNERYGNPIYFETADKFAKLAKKNGVSPISLAVAWVCSNPAITAPIIGARSYEQLKPSLESISIDLSAEIIKEISSLFPKPPIATDRNDELTEHNFGVR
tara:strand:- start:19470 stop:20462 length:993 start_codon:yes stop_codon:yes gene_type:complete